MYKPMRGLKASMHFDQLDGRLQYRPEVFEFYLTADDVVKHFDLLDERIRYVIKKLGHNNIVLHHPMKTMYGEPIQLDVSANDIQYSDIMLINEKLLLLAKKYDIRLLIHPMYFLINDIDENTDKNMIHPEYEISIKDLMFARMDYLQAIGGDHIMFENSISDMFNFSDPEFNRELVRRGYNLAYDISHAFISSMGKNDDVLMNHEILKENIVHYHIVDSMGAFHDSLNLGEGNIKWYKYLPIMNTNATMIYEVYEEKTDDGDCQNAINSHIYLTKIYEALTKE